MTAAVRKPDTIPAETRGTLHSIAGAAIALLVTFAWIQDSQAAVIGAAVIAAIDLALVLAYTRAAWRKALYPVLYAGGGILVVYGVFSEVEVGAILGVAAAVLGTQVAAQNTPKADVVALRGGHVYEEQFRGA